MGNRFCDEFSRSIGNIATGVVPKAFSMTSLLQTCDARLAIRFVNLLYVNISLIGLRASIRSLCAAERTPLSRDEEQLALHDLDELKATTFDERGKVLVYSNMARH